MQQEDLRFDVATAADQLPPSKALYQHRERVEALRDEVVNMLRDRLFDNHALSTYSYEEEPGSGTVPGTPARTPARLSAKRVVHEFEPTSCVTSVT